MGLMVFSRASTPSCVDSKRSTSEAGRRFTSSGEARRPQSAFQNGIVGNASRHHTRQRSSVRRSRPSSSRSRARRGPVRPCVIAVASVTIGAT